MLTLEHIIDLAKGDGDYQGLARQLGVNKGAISKWRHGLSAPDPEYIPELARLSGLSVAAVAVAALATRDRRHTKARAWEQAWTQLARAGLAAVVLAVGLSAPSSTEAQPTQESAYYGKRRRRQEVARVQRLTVRTIASAWHWLNGCCLSRPAGLPDPIWPTLGWRPA